MHTYSTPTGTNLKMLDPDVTKHAKRSIQEYNQHKSAMGGNRGLQGSQYEIVKTSSTITQSKFVDKRDQLDQSWSEEELRYLYQAFIMCEMVDPSTSRSSQVA